MLIIKTALIIHHLQVHSCRIHFAAPLKFVSSNNYTQRVAAVRVNYIFC